MGHQTTVFEEKKHLGGMLRYGIPNYRLPRERLQSDIDCILSTGVEVKLNTKIDSPEELKKITEDYDALYIAIGAHKDKKIGLENEDAEGVISAVEMLKAIGDGEYPDYTGKKVVVIGGGNVAMDCTRTAVRAGADKVSVVYRRRIADMTALEEEIFGAQAEGAEILELVAPSRIEKDENGKLKGLWVNQQMIGDFKRGRPAPKNLGEQETLIECDILVVAIGQAIDSDRFAEYGLPMKWDQIDADGFAMIVGMDGVFSGGDCATGPATVIKAIAAGKAAAANIDEYLGFNHIIESGVDVPKARVYDRKPCGRVNMREKEAGERNNNFDPFEKGMSDKEAMQEANRCLRCDHFGYGCFRGGRTHKW
jgi:NADPH-dependent glutamate synthase beta subunit-like oxidoreductase